MLFKKNNSHEIEMGISHEISRFPMRIRRILSIDCVFFRSVKGMEGEFKLSEASTTQYMSIAASISRVD